jgi:hypothetical protein
VSVQDVEHDLHLGRVGELASRGERLPQARIAGLELGLQVLAVVHDVTPLGQHVHIEVRAERPVGEV